MPALTRRRDRDAHQETWLIYRRDVHVGTINPNAAPQWQCRCGFYPGSEPGECASSTAATFDEARADFEAAWRVFLSKRTEAGFQEWREQRDWTARKYAHVGSRRTVAAAAADQHHAVHPWRVVRQPPAR
jgi:hypothetical protein